MIRRRIDGALPEFQSDYCRLTSWSLVATGGFMDHIKMNVSECGVLTLQAKKGDSYTTAPLAIVEHK